MSPRRFLRISGFVLSSVVLVGLARPSLAADATAPPKVLRHLEFAMTVDESSATETKVAGFDGASSGHATDYNGGVDARGTIAVDVIAATTDGGLVVNVSEDAASRKAVPVRVGILGGKLFYDPHAVVTEEEQTVLAFLARDFVKPDALNAGTSWVDDAAGTTMSGHTTYTVKSVDADAKTVALDFVGETAMAGPGGYTASTQGSMTYDTGVSVPRVFSMWRRTHIANPDRLTTIDMRMSATLHVDSLQK